MYLMSQKESSSLSISKCFSLIFGFINNTIYFYLLFYVKRLQKSIFYSTGLIYPVQNSSFHQFSQHSQTPFPPIFTMISREIFQAELKSHDYLSTRPSLQLELDQQVMRDLPANVSNLIKIPQPFSN